MAEHEDGPRVGGVAAWAPRVLPPIGTDLSRRQELACALRVLARAGFAENLAGHITWAEAGSDELLVNPWGLWWSEVSASDLCVVSGDGAVLDGRWDVTPAIHIHTELHRRRPDARVVIHNHPYWSTVLAAIGELPRFLHQTACLYDGDLVFVDEYDGEIDDASLGGALADRIGDKPVALLANHGVIVTGETIEVATYRAASLDRQCRLTYHALGLGRADREIPPPVRPAMQASLLERAAEVYWRGAVRDLLRTEPDVLR